MVSKASASEYSTALFAMSWLRVFLVDALLPVLFSWLRVFLVDALLSVLSSPSCLLRNVFADALFSILFTSF